MSHICNKLLDYIIGQIILSVKPLHQSVAGHRGAKVTGIPPPMNLGCCAAGKCGHCTVLGTLSMGRSDGLETFFG